MAKTQVAISIDTTYKLSRVLDELRSRISEMIGRLKKDLTNVSISVVAHGDYRSTDPYVTKVLDFTDHEETLVAFVKDLKQIYIGDGPKCHELALREVRTKLSWQLRSKKILIVIGNSYPHPPEDEQNVDRIDWKKEVKFLAGKSIKIHGVQFENDVQSTVFFRSITEASGGYHLRLSELSAVPDVIMAICIRTMGPGYLKDLEKEVRARCSPKSLHNDLEEMFKMLYKPLPTPMITAQTDSVEHAYFWGATLTATSPVTWKAPDNGLEVHSLVLKMASLDCSPGTSQQHLLEVETKDVNNSPVKQPLLAMVGEQGHTVALNIAFSSTVTFRLASGIGPVYLSGQHLVKEDALLNDN